jgi:hypothetical protein
MLFAFILAAAFIEAFGIGIGIGVAIAIESFE